MEVLMAHADTAKGKIVRRFGTNIYGQKKYDKLLKKKPNGPGKDPKDRRRTRQSDFARQLIEKQKLRFGYGLSERQFHNLYKKAKKLSGVASNNLIALLERRFDNVIYRLGWAASRAQARQLVGHKHFLLNGKPANIPSLLLNPGDEITVKKHKGIEDLIRKNLADANIMQAEWVTCDEDQLKGTFSSVPTLEQANITGDIQLVVEYYSRK
jgi:small subunit ribosomal protein S4